MKKLSLLLAIVLLLSLLSGCFGGGSGKLDEADVHPLLYRVTGPEGQEGYLFGTIHVGDENVETAVNKIKPFLDESDALAVEFDIVAYEEDYAAQKRDMENFLLTDGTTITDHMPADTYEAAAALLEKAGLFPKLMQSYNTAMWSQLVEQAAVKTKTKYDMEIGVDRSLIKYCYDRKIEVRDVESAELQYGILLGFSDELNLLMIENTLDNLNSYGLGMSMLYYAWISGSEENLTSLLNGESGAAALTEEQSALMEDYYDKLLTQRNLGMRDKAVEWLEAGDKVFFAVGAAHLLGDDGLVALLRAAGYTVEPVEY